jgi:four helix bundle protein
VRCDSSRAKAATLRTIALREFKESRLRLRILRATGYLTEDDESLIQESRELVKITATMIRNSAANETRRT